LNGRAPRAYVEIHPDDAKQLEIAFGDLVEVTSPHGIWEGPAMVVDTVRRGELFIPFHYGWGRQSANQHTWYARDPMSHQPQLKSAPVAIRRKGFGEPEQWLLDRYNDLAGKSIEPYAARTIGGTINEEVDTQRGNRGTRDN
jgi:predicted molibdopterin-dependent oxidoreductase YjgC